VLTQLLKARAHAFTAIDEQYEIDAARGHSLLSPTALEDPDSSITARSSFVATMSGTGATIGMYNV
jgi:hypothetical protein